MKGKIPLMLLLVLCLLATPGLGLSVQQQVVIKASADASIRSDYGWMNYGSYTYLWVGDDSYTARALVRFDLSSIPSGASIISAELQLTLKKAPSNTMEVRAHRVLEDWLEDYVTWLKCGIAFTWTNFGGDYSSDVEGSVTVSSSASQGDVFTMDVTSYVRDVVSGGVADYGLILEADGEGSILMFYASESGKGPELTVKYSFIPHFPTLPLTSGFLVSVSPSTQSTTPGGSAAYTVEVQDILGFTDNVVLTVSGLPTGATYTFTANNQKPPYTSTLIVQTAHSTPPGTYTLEITGTGGGKTNSETVTLEVESTVQPDFQLRPLTLSQTVTQGETATYTLKVESVAGFSDQVELSVQYAPSSTTVSISPDKGTPTFTATITVETTSQTQPGAYTIEIVATTPSITKTAHIKLIVLPSTQPTTTPTPTSPPPASSPPASSQPPSSTPPPSSPPQTQPPSTPSPSTPPSPPSGGFDFSIAVTPSSIEIYPGESATVSVNVDLLSGRSRQVRIVVEGLPSEHLCVIQPDLVTPPAVSTLTITAGSSTGTYILRVKGISGRIEHYTELTVTVKASRCLIVTATYGSELSWQVVMLRRFRDEKVMSTRSGRAFMSVFNMVYYSFSPQVSQFISKHGNLRSIVKVLISPLIYILRLSEYVASKLWANPELAVIVSGIVASMLIGLVYFTLPAFILVRITKLNPPVRYLFMISAASLLLTIVSLYAAEALLPVFTSTLVLSTIFSSPGFFAKLLQREISHTNVMLRGQAGKT